MKKLSALALIFISLLMSTTHGMSKDYEDVHKWLLYIENDLSKEQVAAFKRSDLLGVPMIYDSFTFEYNKNYPKLLELRKHGVFKEINLNKINRLKKEIDDAHNKWQLKQPQK